MNDTFNASEINSCLCLASKRQNGLLKLSEYLNKCPIYIIEEHGVFWLKTLLQIIENHPITLHAKLSHYCLYVLINKAKCSSELNKLISTSYVEKIVNLLLSSSEPLTRNSLICLFELLSAYRASCGQYKQKIETFILKNLDSESNEISNWASKCYSKLPCLHRSGNNSDIWSIYFYNVLTNANLLLNLILEDFSSGEKYQASESNQNSGIQNQLFKQDLVKDMSTIENYYEKLAKRFKSCCRCLANLFVYSDELIAKIRINEINSFLKRLFYFDYKSMINNQFYAIRNGYKQFLLALNDIYSSILEFSKAYFEFLNTNLIPTSDLINKMLLQYNSISYEENLIDTLPVFYDTVNKWIDSLGTNSGFYRHTGAAIIDNLLANIKPKASLVAFQDQFMSNKHLSKGNGKKLNFNSTQESYNDEQVVIASLKCLKNIIQFFNQQFSFNDFNKIQRTIINLILNNQNDNNKKGIYHNEQCRLYLYVNLYQLCLTKNLKAAPPIAMSTSLFNQAKTDHSVDIRNLAQQSLSSLCAFINPILPISYVQYEDSKPQQQQQQQNFPASIISGIFASTHNHNNDSMNVNCNNSENITVSINNKNESINNTTGFTGSKTFAFNSQTLEYEPVFTNNTPNINESTLRTSTATTVSAITNGVSANQNDFSNNNPVTSTIKSTATVSNSKNNENLNNNNNVSNGPKIRKRTYVVEKEEDDDEEEEDDIDEEDVDDEMEDNEEDDENEEILKKKIKLLNNEMLANKNKNISSENKQINIKNRKKEDDDDDECFTMDYQDDEDDLEEEDDIDEEEEEEYEEEDEEEIDDEDDDDDDEDDDNIEEVVLEDDDDDNKENSEQQVIKNGKINEDNSIKRKINNENETKNVLIDSNDQNKTDKITENNNDDATMVNGNNSNDKKNLLIENNVESNENIEKLENEKVSEQKKAEEAEEKHSQVETKIDSHKIETTNEDNAELKEMLESLNPDAPPN